MLRCKAKAFVRVAVSLGPHLYSPVYHVHRVAVLYDSHHCVEALCCLRLAQTWPTCQALHTHRDTHRNMQNSIQRPATGCQCVLRYAELGSDES